MYKLMLIDDDSLEIEVIKIMLKPLENKIKIVGIASNGREALKLDKNIDSDIIIISDELPGINSLEVCDIIKKRNSNKIIIMIRGYFNLNKKIESIDKFLFKPLSEKELVDTLSFIINSSNLEEKEFLILDKIISGEYDEAEILFKKIIEIYMEVSNYNVKILKKKSFHLLKRMRSICLKVNFNVIKNINIEEYINNIDSMTDIYSVKKSIDSFGDLLFKSKNLKKKLIGEKKISNNLNPAFRYIDSNYREKITLEDVSKVCNLSIYYFSKLFKKDTGINFIDYVNLYKVEKAKEMLCNTNLSIVNISFQLGYDESGYFSKVFKRIVGVTPSEYRNNFEKSTEI